MKDIIYREDVVKLIKKSRNSIDWDEADAGAFFHWTAELHREVERLPSAERTGQRSELLKDGTLMLSTDLDITDVS